MISTHEMINAKSSVLKPILSRILFAILLLTVWIIPQHSGAQSAEQQALHNYIQMALENNRGIQARSAESEGALLEADQVGSLPDLDLQFEYMAYDRNSMPDGTTFRLEAMQMFPWFGSLSTNRKAANQQASAVQLEQTLSESELVREIKELWYMMHEMDHHTGIFRENLELLTSIEQQILARLEGGSGSQVESLRIQIEKEELQNRIVKRDEEVVTMKVRFNKLLNRRADFPIGLFPNIADRPLPNVIADSAKTSNPAIQSLDMTARASQTAIEQARNSGKPSFGLGFIAGHQNPGFVNPDAFNSFEVMLRVQLPIYRNKYRAQEQQARHQYRAVQEQRSEMENRLEADLADAIRQFQNAERDMNLYLEQLIPTTKQALEVSLSNYGSGSAGFEEVIQLQRQILGYELEAAEAQTRRNVAIVNIEYLIGATQ